MIEALRCVKHRGAVAADGKTGDGAGILLPLAPALVAAPRGGLAMVFLRDESAREVIERACADEGIELAGWREVPVDLDQLGETRTRVDAEDRAAPPAAPRRARRRRGGAARLPRAQAHRARDDRRLRLLALLPDGHLQGPRRRGPPRRLLPRPPEQGDRGAVRRLPPALRDEHDADLGARAAVPLPLPQRRDQRGRRQRELDAGPRGAARDARRLRRSRP